MEKEITNITLLEEELKKIVQDQKQIEEIVRTIIIDVCKKQLSSEWFKETLKEIIKDVMDENKEDFHSKEWFNLKEGAAYMGVCYNTFKKFVNEGLKIFEVDGIKRVSKTEIHRFMEQYSIWAEKGE